jgi:tetratricopeptide (TPR) repeat protein
MLVAAVAAYGVIVWQHQRLRSAMVSSSVTSEVDSVRNQALATTGEATRRASAKDFDPAHSPDPNDSAAPRGPFVAPMAEDGRMERGARGGKKATVARKARPESGHAIRPNVQTSRAQSGAPEAVAAQGYAALTHRRYGQAVVLFKRALAGSPSNGTALFGLAEAYRESGQKTAALHTYRRYVETFPAGPNAIAARTQVRLLEGKKF